jgi:hypothetical protein
MNRADESLLKTDTKGRVQTPPERRETLLEEFERSGLSRAQFAQLSGIKYQTFASWVVRRRKQRGAVTPGMTSPNPVRWLEAVVTKAKMAHGEAGAPVTLRLPGGVALDLTEAGQIDLTAALIRALEKPSVPC